MTTKPTDNVAAETDAALDQPKDEMKPVTSNEPKAKDDAFVFANTVKVFAVDNGGYKTSDVEVYNVDNLSAGGALENVSMDGSRDAGSGTTHGAGYNPVDKLDRIAADNYDNIACQQSAMALEGAPDMLTEDVSTNFKTGLIHQLKSNSTGMQDEFGQIYRRNPVATCAEKIIFTRGQMDDASMSDGYPTRSLQYTPATEGAGAQFNETVCQIDQGNYLIRGMNFVVTNGNLTNVTFDVEEITVESDANILDVRADHGKLLDNIASKKVQDWSKLINQKGADFYSPVASGMYQPARHARLLNDIAATDGAIVYAAVKSMCEAYAFGQFMRPKMGGSRGSMRLGAMMTRRSNVKTGHDRASNMGLWTSGERFTREGGIPQHIGVDTFLSLFQSTRSWNGYFGNLIQQSQFQQTYRDALKYVDSMDWKIDKDTLAVFDKTYGWYKDTDADQIIGINRYGIVAPYNPAQYFHFVELMDGTNQLDGICHVMNSVTVSDGTVSTIGSNLFYGMVRYFQEIFLPKIRMNCGMVTGNVYVPFDFATDRFTFGQMFIAEAMDKISRDGGDKYINGAYRQFKDSYGVDPFDDDVTVGFGVSNILNTASFRGLGTEPVLQEANEALKLIISDPEFIMGDARMDTLGVTDTAKGYALLQMHPGVGRVSAEYGYDKTFLFPEIIKRGMILPGLRRQLMMGAKSYFRTRDLPLHPYHINLVNGAEAGNLDTVQQVMENASPGLWRSGNFVPITMGVYSASAGTAKRAFITALDVVAVPRYNGRIAPAPVNVLDAAIADYPVRALADATVVDITGAGVTGKKFEGVFAPLETYNVYYTIDSDFESRMHGSATYRDALVVNTGSLKDTGQATDSALTLITQEGVYMDVPAGFDVANNTLASFGNNVSAVYTPNMSAIMQLIVSNYPFIELPTAGIGHFLIETDAGEYHDDRAMLQANEAFGLKFFAQTYWTRYAEKLRAEKYDKSNDMVDNSLERMDNLLL